MPEQQIAKHQSGNSFQSMVLIVGLTLILVLNGFLLLGLAGLGIALAVAAFGVFFSQRVSPRVVLNMYQARPILNHSAPQLYEIFHDLCHKAKLDPMPGLFFVPSKVPNAFAVGHDETAAVAITDGLLRIMNPRELEGILAHEVAHLQHRDTHVMGLADTLSRITTMLSRIGLFLMFLSLGSLFVGGNPLWFLLRGLILFFSPTVALLLQFALSRSREFNADLGAVRLTGDPYGLASALERLDRLSDHISFWQRILSPQRREPQPALLRTHPDTDERIRILLSLATSQQQAPPRPSRNRAMFPKPRVRVPIQVLEDYRSQVRQRRPERIVIADTPRVRKRPRYRIMSGIFR